MGEPLAIPTEDHSPIAAAPATARPASAGDPLLERAQAGDRVAMGEFLMRHQGRLYHTVLRMVSNPDDAAEVTQDAMLKIVQHLEGFRGESLPTTWMTRIAMNLAISHLRKRRTRDTVSLESCPRSQAASGDDQAAGLRASLPDHREPSPDHRVQTSEQTARLQAVIGRLDDDFRAVLVLRDIEQLDYAEIAEVLALKIGTVKSRLFRARLAVREALRPDAGDA